jgi:hypothetical protein
VPAPKYKLPKRPRFRAMPEDYFKDKADYIEPPEGMDADDARELARLVNKYSRAKIARWSRTIPLPRKGRHPLSAVTRERMWLTEIIEGYAQRYREAGSKKPYTDAQHQLYREHWLDPRDPDGFTKFVAAIKSKLREGRKELIIAIEYALKLAEEEPGNRHAQRRDQWRPWQVHLMTHKRGGGK